MLYEYSKFKQVIPPLQQTGPVQQSHHFSCSTGILWTSSADICRFCIFSTYLSTWVERFVPHIYFLWRIYIYKQSICRNAVTPKKLCIPDLACKQSGKTDYSLVADISPIYFGLFSICNGHAFDEQR